MESGCDWMKLEPMFICRSSPEEFQQKVDHLLASKKPAKVNDKEDSSAQSERPVQVRPEVLYLCQLCEWAQRIKTVETEIASCKELCNFHCSSS